MECYILDYIQRISADENKSFANRLPIKLIFRKSNVSESAAEVLKKHYLCFFTIKVNLKTS